MTIICRVSIHRGCHTSCIGIAATHLVPTRDGLALNLTFFSLELFSRNVHMPTFCLKFNFVSNRSHSSTIIMISFLLQKSQVFLDFLKIKLKLLVAKFIGYVRSLCLSKTKSKGRIRLYLSGICILPSRNLPGTPKSYREVH